MDATSITALSYDDGTLRITPTFHPPGLRLTGALDYGGMVALAAGLAVAARVAAANDRRFRADLGGLDFIDVAALRALVIATLGERLDGSGSLEVVSTSAVVRRLLSLTGWDQLSGWDRMPDWEQVREPAVCLDEGPSSADRRVLESATTDLGTVASGG